MKATPYDIERLIYMLEMGMWDNNLIQSLLDTLDSQPEVFLPNAIGFVNYAAFLLTKVGRHPFGRRMLLASLAWCIESEHESEYGATLVQNIKEISRSEGMELEEEDIRKLAIKRHYGKAESWVTLWDTSERRLDRNDRYQGSDSFGVIAGVSSKLPLTTFEGWLKRLDPEVLNASGRSMMREVFSRFGSDFSSPEESLMEAERLLRCGVGLPQKVIQEMDELRQSIDKGLSIVIRRHRRFAGGDGRLPRSCYSSVCLDSHGDDGGTLNRELMAYTHPTIPGGVFVGDSTDARLNSVLGHPVGVLPGYCALYVLLSAPERNVDQNIFNAVYRETLENNGGPGGQRYLFIVETRVDYVEIENVIDLRLPLTQKWFLDHFRNGDGAHLIKPNGQKNCDFTSMLPTLMHPELGGCPSTHAIGSWMRTSRLVNALIYPSARSDAMISIRNGKLVGFGGWNIVDYRKASEIASGEDVVDYDPWYDFDHIGKIYNQLGVKLKQAPADTKEAGSWAVHGIQARYENYYKQIVEE